MNTYKILLTKIDEEGKEWVVYKDERKGNTLNVGRIMNRFSEQAPIACCDICNHKHHE